MISLAQRLRRRFPELLGRPYFPKRYPIISSHVARTAQSASAFALGFFERAGGGSAAGGLRAGLPQPVALSMLPKRKDAVLRFFDMCPAYVHHEETVERWMAPWLWDHWESILPYVERRLGLPRGAAQPCDVDALWQLCSYEAGLLGDLSGACGAFEEPEANLMEWLEDVRLYETQGPGADINSRIAGVLLADLGASLRAAANASLEGREPVQLARLHFAHCETLTPLLTLLGFFQSGEPAELSSKPLKTSPAAKVAGWTAEDEELLGGVDSFSDDAPLMATRRLAQALSKGGDSSSSMSSSMDAFDDDGSYQGGGSASSVASVDSADSPGDGASGGGGGGEGDHKHGPRAVGCVYKGKQLRLGPLQPPPGWQPRVGPPGGDREWRGGRVSPLGANLVVALYRSQSSPGSFKVRFAHNEQVLSLPFCGDGGTDCGLEDFLERVVAGKAASAAQLMQMCDAAGSSSSSSAAGPDNGGILSVVTADGLHLTL